MEGIAMQILQNDVEHLEKNMKTFSLQLRILQDFIKREFGTSFQEFFTQQLSLATRPRDQGLAENNIYSSYQNPGTKPNPVVPPIFANPVNNTLPNNPLHKTYSDHHEDITNGPTSTVLRTDISERESVEPNESNGFRISQNDKPGVVISIDETDESITKTEYFQLPVSEDEDEEIGVFDSDNYNEPEEGIDPLRESSGDERREGRFQENRDPEYNPGTGRKKKKQLHYWNTRKYPEVFKHFIFESGKSKAKCRKCGVLVSNRLCRLKTHLSQSCASISINKISNAQSQQICPQTNQQSNFRQFFDPCKEDGIVKSKCRRCGRLVSNKAGRMKYHFDQCLQIQIGPVGNPDIYRDPNDEEMDDGFSLNFESESSSASVFIHNEEQNGVLSIPSTSQSDQYSHFIRQ